MFDTLRLASRFLPKLTPRTVIRRLVCVEPARWHLIQVSRRRIAILADQHHLGIIPRGIAEKWHDSASSRMTDHLELTDDPVGESNGVDVEVEHTSGVYPARRDAWTLGHGSTCWQA